MADVCISAVANRHALHFVYYSTTKKTAVPLNEVCMRRASAARRIIVNATQIVAHAHATNARRIVKRYFADIAKSTDEIRTFCNDGISLSAPHKQQKSRACAFDFASAIAHCARHLHRQKYFSQICFAKRLAPSRNRSKTSESVPSDSRRARSPAAKFSRATRAELVSQRNFCSRARIAARNCRTAPQIGCEARATRARVRGRVSFSADR